jgi:hypothetical protein
MEHIREDNRKGKKAREDIHRRTAPHERRFTWKMGYNNLVGQFAPVDYPIMSGSSINRRPKPAVKRKKNDNPNQVHHFSSRSRAKVKDKCSAFYRAIPANRRMFLTLTFIEHVTDQRGNEIFNKFRTQVRKKYPDFEYIRIAEHQPLREEKTIHFHCLCNRYLPATTWNAMWALMQYNSGLRGRRRNGEMVGRDEFMANYRAGTVGRLFNPAQMRHADDITGLAAYVTAYVTQQEKKEDFGCLVWHCSRKVSKMFTREVVSPSTFRYLCSFANMKLDKDTGECWPAPVVVKQFYTMVYVENKANGPPILRRMEKANKWIMQGMKVESLTWLDDDLYRKVLYNEKEARILATKPIRPVDDDGNAIRSVRHRPGGGANLKKTVT